MSKARIGYAGGIALELFRLRARNAELEPLARRAKSLQSTVDDMAREIVELHASLKRQADRRRQNSGPRRRNAGSADRSSGGASSSDASAS